MVMRYTHLNPEHLRGAAARLDGTLAGAVPAARPTGDSTQISTQEAAGLVGVSQKSLYWCAWQESNLRPSD